MEKIVDDFIVFYNSLSESDKFKLGKVFNEKTGGKLSPYNNPTPVAVGIVLLKKENGEVGILAVKRGIPPQIGGLAFPGGFVDLMESGRFAAAREILEETGLETKAEDFFYVEDAITPQNILLMFYQYKEILPYEIINSLKISPETLGFDFINLETELCFPLHTKVAQMILKNMSFD